MATQKIISWLGMGAQDYKNVTMLKNVFDNGSFAHQLIYLSSLYKQEINYKETFQNIFTIGIDSRAPFYKNNELLRLLLVYKLRSYLNRINIHTDLLICSHFGVLDYQISRRLKQLNPKIKIYFIQDAILLTPDSKLARKKVANLFYKNNNRFYLIDKIFVSGQATKDTLIQTGVPADKIYVSGIPRYESLFNSKDKINKIKKNIDLLFLTSAWGWHGYSEDLDILQLSILKDVIIRNNLKEILKVHIKLHPRGIKKEELLKRIPELHQIDISDIEDVEELLKRSKYAISIFYPSTSLFEGKFYGVVPILYRPLTKLLQHISNYSALKEEVLIIDNFSELISYLNSSVISQFSSSDYFISRNCATASENIKKNIVLDLDNIV